MDILKYIFFLHFYAIWDYATAQWCKKYQYVPKTRVQWNNGQRMTSKRNFFGKVKYKYEPYVYSSTQHYTEYELVNVCCAGYEEYSSSICKPICKPACPTNSQCLRPNVCECNSGYVGSNASPSQITCKPHCSPSCPGNATCTQPNTCVCNAGYQGNGMGMCEPICGNECPKNAQCIAPNQCHCNKGYQSVDDSALCEPICNDGCPENAICSEPGKCTCTEGYELGKFEDNSLECVAQCPNDCPANSYCAKPNVCECDEGYQQTANGSCEPVCKQTCPKNAVCTGPNNCTCIDEYAMIGGQCQPICHKPCPEHAVCAAPNKCQCLRGYQLKLSSSYNPFCEPQCPQNCSTFGKCVLPNKCECLEGYAMDEMEDCKPVCSKGCSNGFCYRPEVCICNPGYLMGPEAKCKPVCSMPCHNGSCVEPEICQCSQGYTMKKGSINICEPLCDPACVNGLCVDANVCICHDYYEPVAPKEGDFNHNVCQKIGTATITTATATATSEEFTTSTITTATSTATSEEFLTTLAEFEKFSTDIDITTDTDTTDVAQHDVIHSSTVAPLVDAAICTDRCQCWQEYDEFGTLSTAPQCVHPCVDAYDRPCLNFSLCKCDAVKTQLHCTFDDEYSVSVEDAALVYVCKFQHQQGEYAQDRVKEIVSTADSHVTNSRWIVLGSIIGGCACALVGILLYMKLRQPEERISDGLELE